MPASIECSRTLRCPSDLGGEGAAGFLPGRVGVCLPGRVPTSPSPPPWTFLRALSRGEPGRRRASGDRSRGRSTFPKPDPVSDPGPRAATRRGGRKRPFPAGTSQPMTRMLCGSARRRRRSRAVPGAVPPATGRDRDPTGQWHVRFRGSRCAGRETAGGVRIQHPATRPLAGDSGLSWAWWPCRLPFPQALDFLPGSFTGGTGAPPGAPRPVPGALHLPETGSNAGHGPVHGDAAGRAKTPVPGRH